MSTGQPSPYKQYYIVADIGGTNARFALVPKEGGLPSFEKVFPCGEYENIVDVFEAYIADLNCERPKRAAIAIANPVTGDAIKMTNHSWQFSISETKEALGLKRFEVLNDFTALAMSLPHLGADEYEKTAGGEPIRDAAIGLIGPGTGLGVSGLVPGGSGVWHPLKSEGGHTTFVALTEREQAVNDYLANKFGHVSFERICSGPGILDIYKALCSTDSIDSPLTTPADVSAAGLEERCPRAREALEIFCAALGTTAGNLALTLGSHGGVYIGGGIVPRLGDFFLKSEFRERFESKGRFRSYLEEIPTYIITAKYPALLGAMAALK
jgi:glucokinase|tara:strand:+ start:3105 stop:4079 length:975 start_codon:yes stop_codon:yes gene_type:complete